LIFLIILGLNKNINKYNSFLNLVPLELL